jgi:hypothetical protein
MSQIKNEPPFDVTFTVFGEPASKANSRRIVKFGNRLASIKSKKALSYADAFAMQCRSQMKGLVPTEDLVQVEMIIYYASRRPDLDESLILDCMQGLVYANDRQVRKKMIYWGLDKERPRTVLRVSLLNEKVPDYLLV